MELAVLPAAYALVSGRSGQAITAGLASCGGEVSSTDVNTDLCRF